MNKKCKFLPKILVAAAMIFLLGTLATCANDTDDDDSILIRIAATPRPHREILEYIQPYLLADGIRLEIITFDAFAVFNPALASGEIDASYFQHTPFLNSSPHADELYMLGLVHIEPMGAYSLTIGSIDELPQGATVAIPNDETNQGRALLLLQENGLIALDPAVGIIATPWDITYNPLDLQFETMDAAMLPRLLGDPAIHMAIINTNHVLAGTDLNPMRDSLIIESPVSPYGNGLTVRRDERDNPAFAILLAHLQSERVYTFIMDQYDGAVLPVF